MNSISFESFLKEYNSTGKSKLDGYSIELLKNLTDNEKQKVIQMLSAEAPSLGAAIDALATLDKDYTLELLLGLTKNKTTKSEQDLHKYLWIWRLEKNEVNAEKYFSCINTNNDLTVTKVLSSINEFPNHSCVINFLRKIILNHEEKINIGMASSELIRRSKNSEYLENTKGIKFILKNGSQDQKKQELSKLEINLN